MSNIQNTKNIKNIEIIPEQYKDIYINDKEIYDKIIFYINQTNNNALNNPIILNLYFKDLNRLATSLKEDNKEYKKNNNLKIKESENILKNTQDNLDKNLELNLEERLKLKNNDNTSMRPIDYNNTSMRPINYNNTSMRPIDYNNTSMRPIDYNNTSMRPFDYNNTSMRPIDYDPNNPSNVKKLIESIQENYDPYSGRNTIYENIYKNLWNDTIKNLSEEDKKIPLFIPEDFKKEKLNVPIIEDFLQSQTGGVSQYESIGLKLTKVKAVSENRKNIKKYITTSLFDAYIGNATIPEHKNINHYAICLYEGIKLYQKYLPDFNIRLYGDLSLLQDDNKHIQKLGELIKNSENIDYIKVEQNFNETSALDKNKKKYMGLLGAFYRYYILMDPNIEHCLIVDADNFPTEPFADIVKNWVNDKSNNFLIFKPLYYVRQNINNSCIQQILAGMSGIKKPVNKIINPIIFKKMFEYMNIQFNLFRNEFIDVCDGNKKIKYSNPFTFGFEEQALTNILLPYFILNNLKLIIIPMYFDFGNSYKFFYDKILNLVNNEYKIIIKNKIGIDSSNTQTLTYVHPLYGFNIHLAIILVNFIDKCIKNNKNIFTNFNEIKNILKIKGFYHIYPAFNLNIQIEKINEYVNELYNNSNKLSNLKPIKLTEEAKNEFGISTSSYDAYIEPGKKLDDLMKEKPILDVLQKSSLYKQKYLKYKEKYLTLKNNLT